MFIRGFFGRLVAKLVNVSYKFSSTFAESLGIEVIKTLIDHLAQGLQKWVGWQETGDDCCLKGTGGKSNGIGKRCTCNNVGAGVCCGNSGKTCHECDKCGTGAQGGPDKKCYLSAYCKKNGTASSGTPSEGQYYWPTISSDAEKVHLLARIFLGSVCLIWSGLSQLGFLTGGDKRWSKEGKLHEETNGLGSFMAAMGYDLERLNQGPGTGKTGTDVWKLLSGTDDKKNQISWQEFKNGTDNKSVADYYSEIYKNAEKAAEKDKHTENLCENYPLLVLHILASGYFRAGSAGAKGITSAPKAPQPAPTTPKTTLDSTKKEETPSPRKPRTIREILYWLSALPYSQGYKDLVGRMQHKYPRKEDDPEKTVDQIDLYDEKGGAVSTTLHKDKMTHYLMAACGYCPLVLIGIQGTINTSIKESGKTTQGGGGAGAGGSGSSSTDNCPKKYNEKENEKCKKDELKKEGKVCYRGYHLEVSKFGPLHGLYANGLFGFEMEGSPAQCLDQLRIYVYHCFYQLYFLRKQCKEGVTTDKTAVLGWKSCRYGYQVAKKTGGVKVTWQCKPLGSSGNSNDNQGGSPNQNNGNKCTCLGEGAIQDKAGSRGDGSPLQSFLCDSLNGMNCGMTIGSGVDGYPEIDAHMNKTVDSKGKEHEPHKKYPELCPVPMGWSMDTAKNENHFKDLNTGSHKTAALDNGTYPVHCTGNTLALLLEYYCDPVKPHGTLVLVLRLLACITPTVPRTLGDLFGFYYYIVYIGGRVSWDYDYKGVKGSLKRILDEVSLGEFGIYKTDGVIGALSTWNGSGCSSGCKDTLKCLYGGGNNCTPFLSPLSGQQYGQLSPAMAGTYLSWLVYLIGEFKTGLSQPWYCLLHYPFQVLTAQVRDESD